MNVGDIVLLLNERKTREAWPLARITRLFKSNDGITRSLECKLPIKVDTKKLANQHFTKKKSATKNASKPDNKGVLVQSSDRFTTRGVENIAILEAVTQQQASKQQHVEEVNTFHTSVLGTTSSMDE